MGGCAKDRCFQFLFCTINDMGGKKGDSSKSRPKGNKTKRPKRPKKRKKPSTSPVLVVTGENQKVNICHVSYIHWYRREFEEVKKLGQNNQPVFKIVSLSPTHTRYTPTLRTAPPRTLPITFTHSHTQTNSFASPASQLQPDIKPMVEYSLPPSHTLTQPPKHKHKHSQGSSRRQNW